MIESLNATLSPANIVVTTLLVLVFVYWIMVILGALDTEFLDFDVDTDVDLDAGLELAVDADLDADMDVDAEVDADAGGVEWLNSLLGFFNLGQIPFMVFMTFWILPAWGITMITNDALGNDSFLVGMLVLAASLFISAFIAKFLTLPFVKFFAHAQAEEKDGLILGKTCTITSSSLKGATGQGHVVTDGSPHLLNIRGAEDRDLAKGQRALVIDYNKDHNIYIVEPID